MNGSQVNHREPYHELGVAYFDEMERQRVEQRLVRLGYTVVLQPKTAIPALAA